MARRAKTNAADPVVAALKDLLIVQLAFARVPVHTIREVARCEMAPVTQLTRYVPKDRKPRGGAQE